MKVSLNWIRDFIDIPIEARELAERLTMQGLAVEFVDHIKPDIQGVVVGRVTDVSRHPHADRLVVCGVDTGGERPHRVVCGAPHVVEGGIYPFVPPGAWRPGGMKVKEGTIRGEPSSGMPCSGK